MRPPAAESEQFGTSAVDLFASAMGAFILIALVFMVLFAATPKKEVPDTPETPVAVCPEPVPCPEIPACPECPPQAVCPKAPTPECPVCPAPTPTPEPTPQVCPEAPPCPEPVVCPAQPACPVCPAQPACPVCPICPEPTEPVQPAGQPVAEPVVQKPPVCPSPPLETPTEKPLPETDLVFVIDSTGSMRAEIESLKRELYVVVEVLERMMPSVGVGVVTFNDRLQFPPIRAHALRRLTGDEGAMRELQRFLRSISIANARGPNMDVPEAILMALRAAVGTSFRGDVRDRVIIIITDAYAYEDEMGRTFQIAQTFASTPGSRISTVHVRQNPDSEKYLRRLAEAGGGEFVPDRGSILANVLMGMLEAGEEE